jgi:hypothetical protein
MGTRLNRILRCSNGAKQFVELLVILPQEVFYRFQH